MSTEGTRKLQENLKGNRKATMSTEGTRKLQGKGNRKVTMSREREVKLLLLVPLDLIKSLEQCNFWSEAVWGMGCSWSWAPPPLHQPRPTPNPIQNGREPPPPPPPASRARPPPYLGRCGRSRRRRATLFYLFRSPFFYLGPPLPPAPGKLAFPWEELKKRLNKGKTKVKKR